MKNKTKLIGWVAWWISARSGRGYPRGMSGARREIYHDRTHLSVHSLHHAYNKQSLLRGAFY